MDETTGYDDALARVTRGAALLDEHRPGWALRLDTSRLDIADAGVCTLGQEFGAYTRGLDWLHNVNAIPNSIDAPGDYGFDAGQWDDADDGPEYDALTQAWIEAAWQRRPLVST
jgi:hypothetical protein